MLLHLARVKILFPFPIGLSLSYLCTSTDNDPICARDVPGQRASINLGQRVFGLHTLQVDHGGLDVAMAHPALQCSDVDAVPQMLRCESVAELVEEEIPAVRSLCASVSVFG